MAFTYDSAKLSGSDAMYAVQMAVQNGTVYQLQVENYFKYRGGRSQVHNGIQLHVDYLTVYIDIFCRLLHLFINLNRFSAQKHALNENGCFLFFLF
jgi:hypothetical protein